MQGTAKNTAFITLVAMTVATIMIAQHIAGKAARDTLFLTAFNIEHLPKVMMLSAIISVGAVLVMSRMLARFGPFRLIPTLFLISAVLLTFQWLLSATSPESTAVTLYLHVSALNSILIQIKDMNRMRKNAMHIPSSET